MHTFGAAETHTMQSNCTVAPRRCKPVSYTHLDVYKRQGVGKTTLARIIARRTKAEFVDFSAVTSGVKGIKAVMERAEDVRRFGQKTILFVDEDVYKRQVCDKRQY